MIQNGIVYESIKDYNTRYYKLTMFPIRMFKSDVSKLFKTSRISKILEASGITFFGHSTVVVHKFFIPEFIYILESLPHRQSYDKHISDLKQYSWYANTERVVQSRINLNLISKNTNINLKSYQSQFIKEYDIKKQKYMLNGHILGFEQGLGKTITSLALMESLNKDCIIIIAPKATLFDVWKYHIDAFYKKEQDIWIVNHKTNKSKCKFIILNYESMTSIKHIMTYIKTKSRVGIIVDESHNFLHLSSNRTKNLLNIYEETECNDLLLMSGTPIKALGKEMIPMMKLLDPMFDNDAQNIFTKSFGINTLFASQILKTRMGLLMHRKRKSQVLQLPKMEEIILKVKIPNGNDYTNASVQRDIANFIIEREKYHSNNKDLYNKQFNECINYLRTILKNDKDFVRYLQVIEKLKRNGYSNFDRDMVKRVKWANDYEKSTIYKLLPNSLKKQFNNSKSAIKYIKLKIRGEVLGGLLGTLRSKMVDDMLKHSDIESIISNATKKTIIFTTFVKSVESTNRYLISKKYNPILSYGKTNNIKMELNKFRTDPARNPLIATIQTLATGVTLTEANTIIFLNKPWRHTDYDQAAARIHRIGQDTKVFIYTILLDTGSAANLSTKMEDIMNWSKQLFDAIVNE